MDPGTMAAAPVGERESPPNPLHPSDLIPLAGARSMQQPQQQPQQPQPPLPPFAGGFQPAAMPLHQPPQFVYAPGPAFPLFAPPPIVPFTLPVHSTPLPRGLFELSPLLPAELYRVLNPVEYAQTIQRFQAAMHPPELRKIKRWVLVFGIWTLWFIVLFFVQPEVWFISLAMLLLSIIGLTYSLHQYQRTKTLRETRLRAIAEQETAEYNGARRRAMFGPLGGGGWRLEWSVGRSMLHTGDPFVVYVSLQQTIEGEAQRFPQPVLPPPGGGSTFPGSPEGPPSPPSAYSQPQRPEAAEEPGMEGRV